MAYQTIKNREVPVAMKLGNRQDLLQPAPGSGNTYSRIDGWLRDAYTEVSYSRSFEQTESTIQFQTVQGQDTYSYPTTVRAIKSLVGYWASNNTTVIVEWKDINYVRRYTPGLPLSGQPQLGTPSIVAPFANSLIFRPVPDGNPYNFFLDVWLKPVISADVVSTQLALPDDWLEVVDYLAAMRGYMELGELDKAVGISRSVFGFTDPTTGTKIEGLMERLQNRNQAQSPYVDYGVQPKYRMPYTGR